MFLEAKTGAGKQAFIDNRVFFLLLGYSFCDHTGYTLISLHKKSPFKVL